MLKLLVLGGMGLWDLHTFSGYCKVKACKSQVSMVGGDGYHWSTN